MEEQKNAKKPTNDLFLKNLKWHEHLIAGWPLLLIFMGGAIGGACGGAAYVLNGKIFNSKLAKPLKYIYSVLMGLGAVILYFIVIMILFSIFPGLAQK